MFGTTAPTATTGPRHSNTRPRRSHLISHSRSSIVPRSSAIPSTFSSNHSRRTARPSMFA